MEEVKITFADGTEITADMNGNSYIVDSQPTFPADLSTVEVKGDDTSITYTNAELIECASTDGRYWFSFKQITDDEQLRADVDYLLCLAE